MKKTIATACWLLAAVLLVASGACCLIGGEAALAQQAMWMGAAMALAGLMQLAQVWALRESVFGDRSFFTKGVVCLIVGAFMLGKDFIAAEVLRVLVSMMTLVNAVSLLGAAWAMNTEHVKGRCWLWLVGVVELALGVCGFLRPELMPVASGVVMGVSLMFEGLVLVYTWVIGMRWLDTKSA